MNPPKLYPSPALAQGLLLLRHPALSAGVSLESLSRELGFPKSSVLRHLRTMETLGCVRRLPDLRWMSMMILVASSSSDVDFEARRIALMERARAETGLTVEWYRGSDSGMALRDQRLAEGEVRVAARPGFLRVWGTELDAVARLGYAFDPAAPAVSAEMATYRRNGQLKKLSGDKARKQIALAADCGFAADEVFNANAVRRSAIAVHHEGLYQGVLAVAEAFSFQTPTSTVSAAQTLQSLLDHAHSLH